MDDFVLRSNPQYKHLFEEQTPTAKPEVKWLEPHEGIINSRCGQFQVRRHGEPAEYDLYSIRVLPFARLIKSGFKSFADVRIFLRRSP